jgi:putative membrane protein
MMGWYGSGMSGGLWVFMGLFWIILIAAIIWLVVRLLPSGARTGATPVAAAGSVRPQLPSPLEVLDGRLARGEIDLETYQAHRAALVAARGGK